MLEQNISGDHINPSFFLDAGSIRKIVDSSWLAVWNKFSFLGNNMAGLIGIIIVGWFIKFVANTFLNSITLYNIYGLSIHLIEAVWDSATQLLDHFVQELNRRMREQENEVEAATAP